MKSFEKVTQLRLTEKLYDAAKSKAKAENRLMADIFRDAIQRYVDGPIAVSLPPRDLAALRTYAEKQAGQLKTVVNVEAAAADIIINYLRTFETD